MPVPATPRPSASLDPTVLPAIYGAPGYAYDGAAPSSQDMMAWLPRLSSPDTEINYDRDRMVARARDLVRNDGWAMGAINRVADSAIGAQFFPVPRPNWKALARSLGPTFDDVWAREFSSAIVSEWRMWADDPGRHVDATRRMTFTQIALLNFRTKLIEGDCCAMLPWQPDAVGAGGARYATTIQTIDPDRLSNPLGAPDSQDCRGGVQIDAIGGAIGYHFRRAHQGDVYLNLQGMQWDYFQRQTAWGRALVVHDFDGDRAGQHRGTGILSGVLSRFRMLNRYDATSLQAAVIRTVLGFFITSAQDSDDVGDALDPGGSLRNSVTTATVNDQLREELNGQAPVTLAGVRIPVLPPGEKVQSVGGTGHADDFATFESAVIRSISSATGQSAEEISNDFSKLNYSSFRGALLQSWRTLIRRRRQFQWGFADPIYSAWLEEMVSITKGVLPRGADPDIFVENRAAFARADWIGPGRGWVDPVKERQGEVLGLDAGFGTLQQTCADISGVYFEEVLEQRGHEVKMMKELGLPPPNWAKFGELPAEQDAAKPQPD